MIGSILGGALKVGGSIWGGISAAKAARERTKNVQGQLQKNENWYNRRYNEDATQRADAQRLLTMTEEALKKRNKAAQGTAAVMGSSQEAVAAEKAAGVQALADIASQITSAAEARKDAIEQQYQQNEANLNNQLNQIQTEKANAITEAVGVVGNTAADIADAFDTTAIDDQIRQAKKAEEKNPSIKQ